MSSNETVLITFPVSSFGWIPVITTESVWQEIYEAYHDQQMIDLDDDNGESIEIDLCECVQNAVVTPNPSDDMIIWASSLDTQFFFDRICLQPDLNGWGLSLELSRRVAPLFEEKGGHCEAPKAISLGTVQMTCHLPVEDETPTNELTLTLQYVDKHKHCVLEHGEDEITFGDDYIEQVKLYLSGIKIFNPVPAQVNVRETLLDKTKDLDLSAFDSIPPADNSE